jgi:hypothetical protein
MCLLILSADMTEVNPLAHCAAPEAPVMAPFWRRYGEESRKLMAFDYSQVARWRAQMSKELDVKASVIAPGAGEVGARFALPDFGHVRLQATVGPYAPRHWTMAAHLRMDAIKTPGYLKGSSMNAGIGLDRNGPLAASVGGGWPCEVGAVTWRVRSGPAGLTTRGTVSVSAGGLSVGGELSGDGRPLFSGGLPDYNIGAEFRRRQYVLAARTRDRMNQLDLSAWHTSSILPSTGSILEGTLDLGADVRCDFAGDERPVMAIGLRHADLHGHVVKARFATDGGFQLSSRLAADPSLPHYVEATGGWRVFGAGASPLPTRFGLALSVGECS